MQLINLLTQGVQAQASDLHLSAGQPPWLRVHGDMQALPFPALDSEAIGSLLDSAMSQAQRSEFIKLRELDFAWAVPGLARFRVNAYTQHRGASAVFRTIPTTLQALDDMGAPGILKELTQRPRGLVLVTGPTGSGKSTTLAAMVDHYNQTRNGHIITLEDPIEFVHSSKGCLVSQREVGRDTHSLDAALRAAMREDPDLILIGELRDLATMRLALSAAETGHLVFASLHTASAVKTIDRIIDMFPADEKDSVRSMLSESLEGVLAQTLCKTAGGKGRVAAHEVMIGTPAIRNLIREGKTAQMYSSVQTGGSLGMQTLDQALTDLVRQKRITTAEARSKAKVPTLFPG
jgi:twitching motility protein PilT